MKKLFLSDGPIGRSVDDIKLITENVLG